MMTGTKRHNSPLHPAGGAPQVEVSKRFAGNRGDQAGAGRLGTDLFLRHVGYSRFTFGGDAAF